MPKYEARAGPSTTTRRGATPPAGAAVRWPTGAWAKRSSIACPAAGSSAAAGHGEDPRGAADDGRRRS